MSKILLVLGMSSMLTGCGVVGWFYPPVKIYIQENEGKAELAEAEYSRKTKIAEAEARFESAKFDAKAEVERAKGVAKANMIIGDSLKNNDAYLRYLWIQHLDEGNQVIYIPTEGNLPILEAGKRHTKGKK